jgi:hypothetical protein
MKCPRCEHENPQGMKFCGECAAPLASTCPSCGGANPPENKFCGQCAAPLVEEIELLGGQLDGAAADGHEVAGGVQAHGAGGEGSGRLARRDRRSTARTRATSSLGENGLAT